MASSALRHPSLESMYVSLDLVFVLELSCPWMWVHRAVATLGAHDPQRVPQILGQISYEAREDYGPLPPAPSPTRGGGARVPAPPVKYVDGWQPRPASLPAGISWRWRAYESAVFAPGFWVRGFLDEGNS